MPCAATYLCIGALRDPLCIHHKSVFDRFFSPFKRNFFEIKTFYVGVYHTGFILIATTLKLKLIIDPKSGHTISINIIFGRKVQTNKIWENTTNTEGKNILEGVIE